MNKQLEDNLFKDQESKNKGDNNENYILTSLDYKMVLPLQMEWQPKEDITTYELAMCMIYFFRPGGVMPYEVDDTLSHFRHFKITNHNK